jgi:outer membrane protein assembly factor BamD
MFKKITYIILLSGLLIFSSGCYEYQKVLKTGSNDDKYEAGVDLYEKGDYNKALQFFDILRAVYRGTDKGGMLTYYTANCYYNMKDYTIASYYFKQYMQLYPRGEKAEECAYLSAYCNYLASPEPRLDQTNTYQALSELQMFINMYPNSPKVDEANKLMDELRQKLETKDYRIALLYYKMESYQAAITSFENLLDDYPDTDYREDILYYMVKAYYEYAGKSIYSKKKERYEKTIESYNSLKYFFPDSKYLKELKDIELKARSHIKS